MLGGCPIGGTNMAGTMFRHKAIVAVGSLEKGRRGRVHGLSVCFKGNPQAKQGETRLPLFAWCILTGNPTTIEGKGLARFGLS